ncbi:MAG: response regulator transcription factor [Treponema sp.]|nr:response regulator transcription factor [Treponema sp.]
MTIALVDDEKNVRLGLRTALSKEGYNILEYPNGQEAYNAVSSGIVPDIFILDIMMPVMDGITLLRKLREMGISAPVMFLTSRDEEFDKVLGLELGADDYLCKPFSIKELVARVHVLLRRCKPRPENESFNSEDWIVCGNIKLNENTFTVTENNQTVTLTVTEFRILKTFLNNANQVLTREQLLESAYPEDTYLNDRAIDCHIKRLRKKIAGENIETVYGLGYKFIP